MTKEEIEFQIDVRKRRIPTLELRKDRAAVYELDMLRNDLKRLEKMLETVQGNNQPQTGLRSPQKR